MQGQIDQQFIERNLFTKRENILSIASIKISIPISKGDNIFFCEIDFSTAPQYNTIATGFDQIHAIECSLDYINSICHNSIDPEFFLNETESMKIFGDMFSDPNLED